MTTASLAAPFLDGLALGELRYQRCEQCGTPQSLARYACHRCGGSQLVWRTASGCGTVYAATVVARAPSDEFRALAPYTLALVDLDEGPRLMAHTVAGVTIGERVSATFFPFGGRTLVRFETITPSR